MIILIFINYDACTQIISLKYSNLIQHLKHITFLLHFTSASKLFYYLQKKIFDYWLSVSLKQKYLLSASLINQIFQKRFGLTKK